MDVVAGMPLGSSMNEDLMSNVLKTGSTKKHYVQHFSTQPVINRPNAVDERDKASFYKDLYHFHDIKGCVNSVQASNNFQFNFYSSFVIFLNYL